MEAKFSPRVKDVLTFSREEALRLGNDFIGVEHFFLGILREGEGNAVRILKGFNLNLSQLKNELDKQLSETARISSPPGANIPLVKQAERLLKITYLEAKLFKSPLIGTEHLLLSMLKDDDSVVCATLNRYGVNYNTVKEELSDMIDENNIPRAEMPGSADEEEQPPYGPIGGAERAKPMASCCRATSGRNAARVRQEDGE
jgi:ATP-dependent Clp protease ATP-binding subunit ClpC